MNINDLTFGQLKEISTIFSSIIPNNNPTTTPSALKLDDFCLGKEVIIRTYSAGVWFGTLERKAGNEVILTNARRMWRWFCKESISLSAVATVGIEQSKSKIAMPVAEVWLEVIEIIPVTEIAGKSIRTAEVVKAE